MSVNKVNKTTGELVTLANGTRMWIGTQSAHDAAVQAGTMPNNCMVCITDESNSVLPEWSNAQTITVSTTDYEFLKDGWLVGSGYAAAGNTTHLTLNDVIIAASDHVANTYVTYANVQVMVNKGDKVKVDNTLGGQSYSFVPFKKFGGA